MHDARGFWKYKRIRSVLKPDDIIGKPGRGFVVAAEQHHGPSAEFPGGLDAFVEEVSRIHHSSRSEREYDRRFARIEDRKSTRLNSSHVKISYAVFCLKKKN